MKSACILAATILVLVTPHSGFAQGFVSGAEEGFSDGLVVGGPIGGVVGGAVGVATGTVRSILGIEERRRFIGYVRETAPTPYPYRVDPRIGAFLPPGRLGLYDVPEEYGARGYRYAVAGERILLVDPSSGRIVDILD